MSVVPRSVGNGGGSSSSTCLCNYNVLFLFYTLCDDGALERRGERQPDEVASHDIAIGLGKADA